MAYSKLCQKPFQGHIGTGAVAIPEKYEKCFLSGQDYIRACRYHAGIILSERCVEILSERGVHVNMSY